MDKKQMTCKFCGYKWTSRLNGQTPKKCPLCQHWLNKPIIKTMLPLIIGVCYLYSQWPDKQAECEKDYIAQQQQWDRSTNQFNATINRANQDQATAQAADSQIQLDQLIKALQKHHE